MVPGSIARVDESGGGGYRGKEEEDLLLPAGARRCWRLAMNETVSPEWWNLHLRVARGEALTAAERAAYESGLSKLHQSETLPGDLEALRTARAAVASL